MNKFEDDETDDMNAFKRIDDALSIHYRNCGRNDYYNNYGIGKFMHFVTIHEFDVNFIHLELGDNVEPKDSIFIDIDNQFPLNKDSNNDDRHLHIFNIIKHCYKHGIPPQHNMNNHESKQMQQEQTVEELKETDVINKDDTESMLKWVTRCEDLLYFLASHKASGTLKKDKFLSESFNFCQSLFERDGEIVLIDNYDKNELCESYPIKIIISKSFMDHIENRNNTNNGTDDLCRLFERARYSRARRRFVVPVIFLPNNSCIARSATLSSSGELLLNKSTTVVSDTLLNNENIMESPMGSDLNILRAADIKLLRYLNIKFICDLMVENKKRFGFGPCNMKVASSEKADKKQRYKSFYLNAIPYPGCELFKIWTGYNFNANNLMPQWDDKMNDAILSLYDDDKKDIDDDIKWCDYKKWDIILLTQNYLRLIIYYLQICFSSSFDSKTQFNNNDSIGLLIHCISGWDRTPMFISLIRLSLWADGIIHCDLNSSEILYLTLSYDWLSFTHQLGLRIKRDEHIFKFSFYIIQYLTNHKYSIFYDQKNNKPDKEKKDTSKREEKLIEVYLLFNKIWTQIMEINDPPKYADNDNDNDYGITTYLKNMLPVSIVGDIGNNNNNKNDENDENVLVIFQQLLNMGFDDKNAMKSAKKYPNDVEKAVKHALKHQK